MGSKRGWRSIRVKRPRVGQRCLVWRVWKDQGWIDVDYYDGDYDWRNMLYAGGEVTHWMPLPKPPKEENDERVDQRKR